MRTVVFLSILLGIAFNLSAVWLMGGRLAEAFAPSWVLAGAVAGLTAGLFTIWSRRRLDGQESFGYGLATYFLGILVYWVVFVVSERTIMCVQYGGWTDFDLHDHLMLIFIFLVYGTGLFGIVLIPLSFLARHVLWKIYTRNTA